MGDPPILLSISLPSQILIEGLDKINTQYVDNPDLIEFRDKLAAEVKNHITEQLKSIIIRDVIADQINELETT